MANLEALRQLKRVVKAAPADRLHMEVVEGRRKCGTVRCVHGWARIDPWFKKQHYHFIYDAPRVFGDDIAAKLTNDVMMFGDWPRALNQLITINPHAITKKMVLTNIDLLIAGKKPRSYLAMINEAKRSKKSAPRATR